MEIENKIVKFWYAGQYVSTHNFDKVYYKFTSKRDRDEFIRIHESDDDPDNDEAPMLPVSAREVEQQMKKVREIEQQMKKISSGIISKRIDR